MAARTGVTLVLPLFVFNYLYNRRRMREESRVHRDNWDKVIGFLHERSLPPVW